MQNRPDHSTLLDAIASFLMGDLVPKLEADKALQFRVLIAANLATVVASELHTEPVRLASELARLRALPLTPTLSPLAQGEGELNRELAARLRKGELSAGVLEHLIATARETLEVTNPRFELSDEI